MFVPITGNPVVDTAIWIEEIERSEQVHTHTQVAQERAQEQVEPLTASELGVVVIVSFAVVVVWLVVVCSQRPRRGPQNFDEFLKWREHEQQRRKINKRI